MEPVELWVFDADAPLDGRDAVLDDAERARAARFLDPRDAHRFRVRRAARRHVLGAATGTDPARLSFDTTCAHCGGDHGPPTLVGGPHFNASHAGGVGVLAVSPRPVGVDVEHPDRAREAEDVVERFFAPAEREAYERAAPEDRPGVFLAAWCAKEARLKLRGLGLAAALEELDTTAWPEGVPVADPEDGVFVLLRPEVPGVACAVAVEGEEVPRVRLRRWPA